MTLFDVLAVVLTITAVFSYFNHRYIGLPVTIGVMLIALVCSLLLSLLGALGVPLEEQAEDLLQRIDFDQTLLHGLLSFLLFAGALHININDLLERKWSIGLLASIGTLVSTFLIGTLTWIVVEGFGIQLSFVHCLLFGALISPTDPIAVLGILRKAGAPKSVEMKIAGESLFNDGIGIVVFLIMVEAATGGQPLGVNAILWLFVQEAVGGALFGLAIGYLAYGMLRRLDSYQVEVLITLALVTGGYALAEAFHLSAPITIVVAGLLIGNQGRRFAMSDESRHHLDIFWELIDDVLNAVLFVLIGLEILILSYTRELLLLGLVIIPLVLVARAIAIGIPMAALSPFRAFTPGAHRIMTWGGLRGGISIALALSLPASDAREVILAMTYTVVIFSILVQGLTIERLITHTMRRYPPDET